MENWFEVEYILLKTLRLQPSEVDNMEFYRVEILLENHKKWVEKENEERKKQDNETKATGFDKSSMSSQTNSMMKDAAKGLPKMGSLPKMPKF